MNIKSLYIVLFVFFALQISSNAQQTVRNINENKVKIMKFELPVLPYATNALEPVMSQKTVEFHYGKHLQTYITNLNNLVPGSKFENADLETIVKDSDGAIFNNAGQVLNHQLYFLSLSPNGGGAPKGKLADAIAKEWTSFENFQKEFNAASLSLFGSGWTWLASDASGKLQIVKEPNAGNPLTKGLTPILGFDVWEHAYYLDFQNRRADHVVELWKILDWNVLESRYK